MVQAGSELDRAVFDALARDIGREAVAEIVGLYAADAPQRMEAYRSGLASGDLAGVRRAAHTLKSTAGNLGARSFMKLCEELEAAARSGDAELLQREQGRLEARLAAVLSELEAACRP